MADRYAFTGQFIGVLQLYKCRLLFSVEKVPRKCISACSALHIMMAIEERKRFMNSLSRSIYSYRNLVKRIKPKLDISPYPIHKMSRYCHVITQKSVPNTESSRQLKVQLAKLSAFHSRSGSSRRLQVVTHMFYETLCQTV